MFNDLFVYDALKLVHSEEVQSFKIKRLFIKYKIKSSRNVEGKLKCLKGFTVPQVYRSWSMY